MRSEVVTCSNRRGRCHGCAGALAGAGAAGAWPAGGAGDRKGHFLAPVTAWSEPTPARTPLRLCWTSVPRHGCRAVFCRWAPKLVPLAERGTGSGRSGRGVRAKTVRRSRRLTGDRLTAGDGSLPGKTLALVPLAPAPSHGYPATAWCRCPAKGTPTLSC